MLQSLLKSPQNRSVDVDLEYIKFIVIHVSILFFSLKKIKSINYPKWINLILEASEVFKVSEHFSNLILLQPKLYKLEFKVDENPVNEILL